MLSYFETHSNQTKTRPALRLMAGLLICMLLLSGCGIQESIQRIFRDEPASTTPAPAGPDEMQPAEPAVVEPAKAPIIDGVEGYDVIVAGGEPEGIAAALSAARNGMKTLLVEESSALGGLMTLGMLNFLDMNHDSSGTLLTQGIFQEFYNDMGNAFDVEEAKEWFWRKTQAEPNLTVLLNTKIIKPVMQEHTISGLMVQEEGKAKTYRSLTVIDATVDADVAVAAGVPYTIGGEDYGEAGLRQGVTLVFELAGVNWNKVVKYLKNDGNGDSGADTAAAWGYGDIALNYQPSDAMMRLRGPNIARQANGNVLINALVIFGVDGLNPLSRAAGILRGRQEIPHIVEFMRENFKGFENARFVDAAPRLYVRETRHIQGEYRLTITDVLENRDQWDRIAHGSYPVDVQPTGPNNYGNVIGAPEIYSIPFRCIVPQVVDQLLVVSRSASYDSLPHGSARVIPIGMAVGEAAGVACAWAVRHEQTFREMTQLKDTAIPWIQNRLKAQGAYLTAYDPPRFAVMDHWAYPGVRTMRELGLTEGGYSNDYRLEIEITKWALQNKLNKVLRLVRERTGQIPERTVEVSEEVTVGEMFQKAAFGISGKSMAPAEARAYLENNGILSQVVLEHCQDLNAIPNYGQLLSVLGAVYDSLMKTN